MEYTHFRDFTVRLKYAATAANVAGDMHPDFIAIVSAADLAGAEAEAAKVVASLKRLVEVIGIEEGATRQPRPEADRSVSPFRSQLAVEQSFATRSCTRGLERSGSLPRARKQTLCLTVSVTMKEI